jgi:class 3 adenylate cyclase/tetratricopeptide (TPR) repeat protein
MMFADITGSTALTEKLDAEEAHELLYGATQRMCAAIENNRGTVCRFMGDGVMAMFGAPLASERHAVDACAAALEMQQAIRDYTEGVDAADGKTLQIRVGLHSGEVVVLTVGEGDKIEYDASGPTVPIAARMEQAAQPGEVYLTAATCAMAEGTIETKPLEPVQVKGIAAPITVFALNRVRSVEEIAPTAVRTAFVGRRAELNQFAGILDTCIEDGHGQTVYVRGEPGIGKTRLVEEFARIANEKGVSMHRGLVLPFGVGKGQDAIRSLTRTLLGIRAASSEAERQQAADAALNDGRLVPDQTVYLNDLLDLPQPLEQRALYDAMENAARNEGKQALLSTLLSAASDSQALLVIIEDVHWADAITLAHLCSLCKTAADCPAVLVMTSRIEGDQLGQSWRNSTQGAPFVTIDLGPLRKQDSMMLIGEFTDMNDTLARSCLERASGNPLFLEQLLRNAREGATESLPDSIQSLVLARIDRLAAEDKRALQAAAVIGQRFHPDVLNHLLETSDFDCRELIEHNLLRSEGEGYLFAHALIQEGVYSSLLKRQRRAFHQRAAEWFVDDLALHAQHLGHAGDDKAPGAYLEAAHEQARQYRSESALALIERGLMLQPQQADRHPLTCLKAELLLDMDEVESSLAVYRQAENHADSEQQLCDVWLGLAAIMRVKTHYEEGLVLLEKAEPAATRHNLTSMLSRLHHLRGNLCFSLGRAEECRNEHLLALELAEQSESPEYEARALGGLGDAEYVRGRLRTAGGYYTRCIDIAREHGFGRIELAHLAQRGYARLYTGDWRAANSEALAAIELATKVGGMRAEMNASHCANQSNFDLGQIDGLGARAQRVLDIARTLGARGWEPCGLTFLGISYSMTGRHDEAREALTQSVSIARDVRAFQAAQTLGAFAFVMADDAPAREAALKEGEMALAEGPISHNYFWFYRFAMDALIAVNDWERVEKYATALEGYTREEPLQWSDFFIARGRALAAFGRGKRDEATMKDLQRLRDTARQSGLKIALPALESALSQL